LFRSRNGVQEMFHRHVLYTCKLNIITLDVILPGGFLIRTSLYK